MNSSIEIDSSNRRHDVVEIPASEFTDTPSGWPETVNPDGTITVHMPDIDIELKTSFDEPRRLMAYDTTRTKVLADCAILGVEPDYDGLCKLAEMSTSVSVFDPTTTRQEIETMTLAMITFRVIIWIIVKDAFDANIGYDSDDEFLAYQALNQMQPPHYVVGFVKGYSIVIDNEKLYRLYDHPEWMKDGLDWKSLLVRYRVDEVDRAAFATA